MPVFPKPKFPYEVDVSAERERLRRHRQARAIPARKADRVLVCSWNIANFGAQARGDPHIALIAEILSWFDVIALQEVRHNYLDVERVRSVLGTSFRYVMSDVAGNDERLAYLYRYPKVQLRQLIGAVVVPPASQKSVKLPGIRRGFRGFDRSPYVVALGAKGLNLLFANTHNYFGPQDTVAQRKASIERRALEAYALARWADLERSKSTALTKDIIALGDMNMPKRHPSDPIFQAITRRGMVVPEHSTKVASSIASDAEYDQVAIFPGPTQDRLSAGVGVYDFDTVTFPDLWEGRTPAEFKGYVRYYLSDHRPIWFEMAL